MGKSSKPTIGYWYWMTEHFGVCYGPVDAFYEVKGGGVSVNASNLYGGEKKEGGINGRLAIYMGDPTQAPPAELVSLLGAPQPAYRGLLTLVFDGIVGAMNPYIKPLSFRVGRWVKGWRTPVWEPDLCRIDKGMNPAHILYRLYTDPVTGLGQDAQTVLDLDRMREAAQILFNEKLGLVLKWTRRDVINGLAGQICSHIGGEMSYDPRTGKQFLRLYRGGYDVASLPLLDESNVLELTSHEQATIYGAVNSITMTYHNADTDKDESVTVTNPANIHAQGETIDKPLNYPGLWCRELGVRAAMRELNAVSSLPARGKLKLPSPMLAVVNGKLQEVDIIKGDVLAFSWKELNLVRLPIRVLEIDRGTWTDNAIIVSYTTDVNALPTQSYIGNQPTTWVEPDTRPQAVPAQRLVEASYRDLAATLRDADLAALNVNSGHVGSLGARASGVAYNYTLVTRVGDSGTFTEQGSGDFAPTGLLPTIVPASVDPIVAVLTSTRDLDQVDVGSEALIDDEVLRVDAIDATTGAVTLARGCGDTLPAAHNANARVWFTDYFTGADPTEYLAGETIQAKLLTRTGQGELDPALSPIASVTLSRRQARPYPPADLKVGGQRAPAQVVGAINLSWSHRDRKAQRDQLVDATQPSIGPETGTTYTVRLYLNGALVQTRDGISAASYTTTLDANGSVRVEVVAVRDGLTSWQVPVMAFDYVASLVASGHASDALVGTPYGYTYTATGGKAPLRWALTSGQLPKGLTLDASTGKVSGTPTDPGQSPFALAVTDAAGQSAALQDTLTVKAAASGSVVSLLHFDGTDGATTFTDQRGLVWTAKGSPRIVTDNPRFGTGCGSFAGGYISTPANAALALGKQDFTIEFWLRTTVSQAGTGKTCRFIAPDAASTNAAGALQLWQNDSGTSFGTVDGITLANPDGTGALCDMSGVVITDGQWHHVAFARAGNQLRAFFDGLLKNTVTDSTDFSLAATTATAIGGTRTTPYQGFLDELRITSGFARYTASFAPPTAPFTD